MTDITELEQRVERIISDMKLKHGVKDTYAPVMKWDEFLALVEALENAQQRNTELEQEHCGGALMEREIAHSDVIKKLMSEIDNRDSRIAELEESHAQVIQSRDHYKRIIDEGLRRLAESRSVKLPDDEDGQAYGFGKWANGKLPATAGAMTIAYCEDAWRAAFEVFSSTAGIKVEAE